MVRDSVKFLVDTMVKTDDAIKEAAKEAEGGDGQEAVERDVDRLTSLRLHEASTLKPATGGMGCMC